MADTSVSPGLLAAVQSTYSQPCTLDTGGWLELRFTLVPMPIALQAVWAAGPMSRRLWRGKCPLPLAADCFLSDIPAYTVFVWATQQTDHTKGKQNIFWYIVSIPASLSNNLHLLHTVFTSVLSSTVTNRYIFDKNWHRYIRVPLETLQGILYSRKYNGAIKACNFLFSSVNW